jgi:hypothetical protein
MEETKNIPEINFSDNKIVLQTKEVPIRFNGEETTLTMQKLPAGEKQSLVVKSASTKIIGNQVQGNIDAVGYQIGLLSRVIIKAPFPTDEATIRTLPDQVVEYLFEEYESWASVKKKV